MPPAAGAGQLTPELQKQVRAATFEVVVHKPDKDSVSYEKPLPLELIPFSERNDHYWPIGTAFALSPDTFVTAAHVIAATVGSQFGAPGIRDSDGHVYPISRILKFHNREDFVVFAVSGAPPLTPLPVSTTASVDDGVFAVGNALGEGVVIRDGLLTSMTPEAQDGKWKWLRFSAAASPGNSGGPLLDAQGRVIGVVLAKSPNENLNYALPIALVLGGPDKLAVFETRESFGVPRLLQAQVVGELRDSFPLPLSFAEFSSRSRLTYLRYFRETQDKLAAANADTLFPRGQSATLLAKLYSATEPGLITQQDDGSWDTHSCEGERSTLPGDGMVWFCRTQGPGGTLFRIVYPGTEADERHYRDSKDFLDTLLRGMPLPRLVGTQPVRVTSLGAATQESLLRDHYGRVWQLRSYPMGYADMYVTTLALPTPDGYVGMATIVPSSLQEVQGERYRFVADYLYLTYAGSLPQWQAFLQRRELRPACFEHDRFEASSRGVRFESARVTLDSTGLVTPAPQTSLELQMNYIVEHGVASWDVAGIILRPDRDRKTYLGAYRQARPAADSAKERRDRWDHMTRHDGEFAGTLQHDDQLTDFWVRTVAGGGANAAALYELVYNTDHSLQASEAEDMRVRLTGALKITE